MKDISVITVTHDSVNYIENLILSVVTGAKIASVEHFVVDNGSSDGTAERVEEHYSNYITFIKNRDNLGFGAANNLAFSLAQGRFLLFLNPDMRVEEGSLDRLIAWLDVHPEAGIVSCRPVDAEGKTLWHRGPRAFPKWYLNLWWLIWPSLITGRTQVEDGDPQVVDVVLGAFMLVRREMLERLGFAFDPRYFLTFEDADLCREAKRLGYQVVYYPAISCIDFNSRSFAKKEPLWIYRQVSRGMLTYFRKWSPWYVWIWLSACIPLGYAIRFVIIKFKSSLKGV